MMVREALQAVGRVALDAAVFLAALALTCGAIGAVLPFREIPQVAVKLEEFRRHAAEYDTLFIGSSRIYHQIIPSVFDQHTAARGLKTKSFNAGVDGMRSPEMNYYIRQLLRCRPSALRWVFIEPGAVRVPLDPDKNETLRLLYWHDWATLRLITRVALADRKPPKKWRLRKVLASYREPLAEIASHVPLFARNVTNLGRASILTDHLGEPPESFDRDYGLGPARDGYLVTGRDETISPASRLALEAGVAARRAKPHSIDYADRESQRAFEGVLESFERRGAGTVQLIPPTTGSRKFHLLSAAKTGRIVLDYSDIDKYAALYEPRFRVDTDHLNHAGAEYFTRLVAEEFCAKALPQP